MTSSGVDPARAGALWANQASRPAMPIRQTTEIAPTSLMGRSCSVRSSTSPWARLALAARAEVRPPISGPASLTRVQMAATPMTPAPMKRTSRLQTVAASSSAGAPAGGGGAVGGGAGAHEAARAAPGGRRQRLGRRAGGQGGGDGGDAVRRQPGHGVGAGQDRHGDGPGQDQTEKLGQTHGQA